MLPSHACQHLLLLLLLLLRNRRADDGISLGPQEVYAYLCRVMYNRRNKFDPLWNSLIVAGIEPPHAGASSEVRAALLIWVSEMFCGKVRRVCIALSAFWAWSSLAWLTA
jgi:hypothetical protein